MQLCVCVCVCVAFMSVSHIQSARELEVQLDCKLDCVNHKAEILRVSKACAAAISLHKVETWFWKKCVRTTQPCPETKGKSFFYSTNISDSRKRYFIV